MSYKPTPEQIAELRETFNMFDQDHDGSITSKELGNIMHALGQNPTEAELQDMIIQADLDGNGTLEFDEFVNMMAVVYIDADNEDDLREAFSAFDKEDKGYINSKDLKLVLLNLGESANDEEIAEMIREADADGDGRVNFEDFYLLMTMKELGKQE